MHLLIVLHTKSKSEDTIWNKNKKYIENSFVLK